MLHERDMFKLLGNFIASEVRKQFVQLEQQVKNNATNSSTLLNHLQLRVDELMQTRAKQDALALRVIALETEDRTDAIRASCAKQLQENIDACVQRIVAEFFDEHPVLHGKDGKDGKDGADGIDGSSVDLDDIAALLQSMLAEAISKIEKPPHIVDFVVDRNGHLIVTMSDGKLHDVGRVVGADGQSGPRGENGKDGVDGLGIEQIDYDGERTMRLVNEKADRSFVLPIPIYRGHWRSGQLYERGDCVSSDGCQYTAMENTDREPGTLNSGWRLSVKRGRDGKNPKQTHQKEDANGKRSLSAV